MEKIFFNLPDLGVCQNLKEVYYREYDGVDLGKEYELDQIEEERKQQYYNQRVLKELFLSLCCTSTGVNRELIENLFQCNVDYKNLANLTDEDLVLFGLEDEKKREELLTFFATLPNQSIGLDEIASKYEWGCNNEIIDGATFNLRVLSSLRGFDNIKLEQMPTEDFVLGEKYFASRYTLETVDKIRDVTDDIEKELLQLEQLISSHQLTRKKTENVEEVKKSIASVRKWLIISSAITGAVAGLWFWKMRGLNP